MKFINSASTWHIYLGEPTDEDFGEHRGIAICGTDESERRNDAYPFSQSRFADFDEYAGVDDHRTCDRCAEMLEHGAVTHRRFVEYHRTDPSWSPEPALFGAFTIDSEVDVRSGMYAVVLPYAHSPGEFEPTRFFVDGVTNRGDDCAIQLSMKPLDASGDVVYPGNTYELMPGDGTDGDSPTHYFLVEEQPDTTVNARPVYAIGFYHDESGRDECVERLSRISFADFVEDADPHVDDWT